jgi:hypothetical protein
VYFSSTIWGHFKNQNGRFDECFVFQNMPPFYFIFHVIPNGYLPGITKGEKKKRKNNWSKYLLVLGGFHYFREPSVSIL